MQMKHILSSQYSEIEARFNIEMSNKETRHFTL